MDFGQYKFHFKGTYNNYDELPKEGKIGDIVYVYDHSKNSGQNYIWFFDKRVGFEPLTDVSNYEESKRKGSLEEIDMIAAHMLKNIALEHKNDNEVLHLKADAVIQTVLKNLGLDKTYKEYKNMSSEFWYS